MTRTTALSDTSIWQNAAVLVDKPPEWTSFDVCNKLRGMLGVKKVRVCWMEHACARHLLAHRYATAQAHTQARSYRKAAHVATYLSLVPDIQPMHMQ